MSDVNIHLRDLLKSVQAGVKSTEVLKPYISPGAYMPNPVTIETHRSANLEVNAIQVDGEDLVVRINKGAKMTELRVGDLMRLVDSGCPMSQQTLMRAMGLTEDDMTALYATSLNLSKAVECELHRTVKNGMIVKKCCLPVPLANHGCKVRDSEGKVWEVARIIRKTDSPAASGWKRAN